MSKGKKPPKPNPALEAPFDDVLGPRTSPEFAVGDVTEVDELSGLDDKGPPPAAIPPELTLDEPRSLPPMAPGGYFSPPEYTPPTGSATYPPFPVHPSQPSIPVYGYAPTGPQRMSATSAAVVLGIGSMLLTASGLYAWDAGLFSSKPRPAPVLAPAPAPVAAAAPAATETPPFEPSVGPVRFTIVEDGTNVGVKGLERGLFEGTELGLNAGTLAKLSASHGGGSFVGALWLTALDLKTEGGHSTANATCKMALTPEIGVEGTRNHEATAVYESDTTDVSALSYLAAQECGKSLIVMLDEALTKPTTPEPAVEPSVVSAEPPKAEPVKKTKKKRKKRRSRRKARRRPAR